MNKIAIIVLLCVAFFSRICFSYENNVRDNNYYEYEFEPKLDILCNMIKKKAADMIKGRKPNFEVELTQEERYFSSDAMSFFTGYEENPARYSSVKKLAVWVNGLTLVTGWTRDSINYYIEYVYTTDYTFVLSNGIRPRTLTSELEKFFNNNLYNISAEYGNVGHLEAIWGNDDWSKPRILICYSGTTIDSIEAWDDNAYGDAIPAVPNSRKIDNYVNMIKRQMYENELDFLLNEIKSQKPQNFNASIGTKRVSEPDLRIVKIILLSFSIGAVLSLLIVFLYRKELQKHSYQSIIFNTKHIHNTEAEAEYIDAEFTEKMPNDEFNYPYEDIGDMLRQ